MSELQRQSISASATRGRSAIRSLMDEPLLRGRGLLSTRFGLLKQACPPTGGDRQLIATQWLAFAHRNISHLAGLREILTPLPGCADGSNICGTAGD